MNIKQRRLKLELRIKRSKKAIDKAVEWNFGYCPNEKWFDNLLESMRNDEVELKGLANI